MWQCSVLRITFWLDYWIYIMVWTFVNGIIVVLFHPIYESLSFACRSEILITINFRILCYCDWKLHVFAFNSKHIFQSLIQLTYNKYQVDVDIHKFKQLPMNDDWLDGYCLSWFITPNLLSSKKAVDNHELMNTIGKFTNWSILLFHRIIFETHRINMKQLFQHEGYFWQEYLIGLGYILENTYFGYFIVSSDS